MSLSNLEGDDSPGVPGDWVMSSRSQVNCPGSRFNSALLAQASWPGDLWGWDGDVIDQDDSGLDSLEN